MKGLIWKLGLITSLAALPILAPFCARDDCYDRGGAVDSTGTNCAFGGGRVEPLGTWSWPFHGWLYLLVVGAIPGLALGAVVSRIRQNRSARRAA